ncbi:MAG: tRNA (adenosine(37)-N6)-dimethylallyltransferase MiaA [Desulfobacterales bacterium]|nr:tRNA (adenosine(37)-N6)-dimethylallyltransferase MiaA [Desulfobacterales bacterium]
MKLKPKIIVICGSTGVGKTAISIEIAKKFNGEIVNADSMQIYKYLDIGTAKPNPYELSLAPHHLISIIEPDEAFDAGKYSQIAKNVIEEINLKGKLAIIVGGTGLYIKALIHGLFRGDSANESILEQLKKEAGIYGSEYLHNKLASFDPDSAKKIHPNDLFRIIRAIEIYESTGIPISKHQNKHGFSDAQFDALKIGLNIERNLLYEKINDRVHEMLKSGFLEEVENILKMGYSPDLKPLQSIGYRHLIEYIYKQKSFEETIETLKQDTRRYAKRQLTWFRADNEITWTEPSEVDKIENLINGFLKNTYNIYS